MFRQSKPTMSIAEFGVDGRQSIPRRLRQSAFSLRGLHRPALRYDDVSLEISTPQDTVVVGREAAEPTRRPALGRPWRGLSGHHPIPYPRCPRLAIGERPTRTIPLSYSQANTRKVARCARRQPEREAHLRSIWMAWLTFTPRGPQTRRTWPYKPTRISSAQTTCWSAITPSAWKTSAKSLFSLHQLCWVGFYCVEEELICCCTKQDKSLNRCIRPKRPHDITSYPKVIP